jgi:tetratricopeptide (TPR) repeat protein
MTIFQLLMLGASAFFAFKIYEHIQTLQEPQERDVQPEQTQSKSVEAFSPFTAKDLVQKADEAYENSDKEKALAFLNEANVKEPSNEDILYKIAFILQQRGDDEEALKYYKDTLYLNENNEFVHNSMASIYKKRGEFVSAKMHLQSSLAIDDKNPITYYNYGNLLVQMQKEEEAVEMYSKALDINPEFNEAKEEIEKIKGK